MWSSSHPLPSHLFCLQRHRQICHIFLICPVKIPQILPEIIQLRTRFPAFISASAFSQHHPESQSLTFLNRLYRSDVPASLFICSVLAHDNQKTPLVPSLCPFVLSKRPSALIISEVAAGGNLVHKEAGVSEVCVSDQKISISFVTVSHFWSKCPFITVVQRPEDRQGQRTLLA